MMTEPPDSKRPVWFLPILALVIIAGLCSLTAILVVTIFTVAPDTTSTPRPAIGLVPTVAPFPATDSTFAAPTLGPFPATDSTVAAPTLSPLPIPSITPPPPPAVLPATIAAVPPLPRPTIQLSQPAQAYYHVINRHSQMCLAAQLGTQWIVQEVCDNNAGQQLWDIPPGAAPVSMHALTGPCVGYNDTNNKLVQVGCNRSILPWTVQPMGTFFGVPNPLNLPHAHATIAPQFLGTYFLIQYAGQCLDDDSWSHAKGQVIIHDDCRYSDNDNQLWGIY